MAGPDDPVANLIQEGDYRRAISLCADQYAGALGRLCMALLGAQSDAEEVVQETLLAAHTAMPGFRGDGTVRAWLYGIARRQCARHLEKQRRHRRHLRAVPGGLDEGGEAGEEPGHALVRRRRARAVRDALARLKPTEREALVLRYQGELSYREIGALCGVEETTARKRASRGLAHLRALLPSEVIE